MNLPNKLTLLRIIMIPIFVFLLLGPVPYGDVWSAAVFILAAVTDAFDGKIARKRGLVTNFGKFADPLADKMLVCSALVCLVGLGRLPSWALVIILCRDFAVDGMRMMAIEKGEVIAASRWGKLKTVSQMIMVPALLISSLSFWPQPLYRIFCWGMIILAVALTVGSGIDYIVKGWKYIK